jgi:hypothetical protein
LGDNPQDFYILILEEGIEAGNGKVGSTKKNDSHGLGYYLNPEKIAKLEETVK